MYGFVKDRFAIRVQVSTKIESIEQPAIDVPGTLLKAGWKPDEIVSIFQPQGDGLFPFDRIG